MVVKQKDNKCGVLGRDNKPCGRDLYDEEYCIFHSEDIKGKREKFIDAFWMEYERQREEEEVYGFVRFVFPENMDFRKTVFEKESSFWGAKFSRGADFESVAFSKDTDFMLAWFSGDAHFKSVKFLENVSFDTTMFSGDVAFTLATFEGSENFRFTRFSGEANFCNVSFSGEAVFWKAKFSKQANFRSTAFSGNTSFRFATFFGDADFRSTTFLGDADFWETCFFGVAYFWDAIFSKKAAFHAGFSGNAYFQYTTFLGDAEFWSTAFLGNADFQTSTFSRNAYFQYTSFLGDVNFRYATFSGPTILGLFDSLKNKGFSRVKGLFKIKDFLFSIGPEIAKENPVINRKIKDAWYLNDYKANYPITYWIWKVMANCGQSIWRWATWSLFFSTYFAVNFFLIDYSFTDAFKFSSPLIERSFHSYFYYSIVTFTTLGFGDITPIIATAQKWVIAEVIMGYIMLGGLISILANKLARRSE